MTEQTGKPSPSNRRLLVVINSLGTGGAETQIRGLLPELVRTGWELRVLALMEGAHIASELRDQGICVVSLNLRRLDPRWLFTPFRVRREINRFRPGVVHAHLDKATVAARLARIGLKKIRLVDTVHYTLERRSWRTWAFRLTSRLSELTTLLSEEARTDQIERSAVRADRTLVVPNGVDTEYFRPSMQLRESTRREFGLDDKFIWVTIGRLIPEKDQGLLIDSVAWLRSHGHDLVLFIVGDGPLRQALEKRVHDLDLGAHVCFVGSSSDVRPFLNMADAFVLSSRSEGLPMALLEAMSMGLTALGTSVGSIPLIIGEDNAVPHGSARSLGEAMKRIMEMREEDRVETGRSMREKIVGLYSVTELARRWDEIYLNRPLTLAPHPTKSHAIDFSSTECAEEGA